MWELLCGTLLLIGLASADDPVKQLNVTKEENNISKRYIVSIPQYNSLLYTNSQVLPTQQLIFGNAQALVNYINSIQLRAASYGIPNYYILPQNNFVQTYTPPNLIQNNILPAAPQVPQRIVPQQVLPKQKPYQQVIPQQVVPQVLRQQVIQLKQQAVPQQIVPQVLPQQTVPQQIVPQILRQQVLPIKQQVVPQQIVPQVLRQQVIPQQIVPQVLRQQILPQQIPQQVAQQPVPQQLVGQQVISQRILRPQIVPQQVIPQPLLKQQIPPQIPQQIQNGVQPQSIIPYFQNNIVTPLVQQRIAPLPLGGLNVPLQYQYYQPQPPRSQAVVGNEPYPYEIPPGQTKIPATKHVPVYVKAPQVVPQVDPLPRAHNLIYSPTNPYNPISYFQGQVNSQPQSVLPYLQTSNSPQQVVRIGYEHPHLNQDEEIVHHGQGGIRTDQPHTVYADPNLFSSENNQAVVRIGYGHPHFDQLVQQRNDNGPQQIKLDLPQTYGEGEPNDYRYETNSRPARTLNVPDKDRKNSNKAESET